MMPAQWRTLGRELTEGLTKPLTLKPAHELNSKDDDLTLYGVGAASKRVGYSNSGLRKLEDQGIIPPALRLEGSNRRVYRESDIQRIQEIVSSRKYIKDQTT